MTEKTKWMEASRYGARSQIISSLTMGAGAAVTEDLVVDKRFWPVHHLRLSRLQGTGPSLHLASGLGE
jgi:hypothetical protein